MFQLGSLRLIIEHDTRIVNWGISPSTERGISCTTNLNSAL